LADTRRDTPGAHDRGSPGPEQTSREAGVTEVATSCSTRPSVLPVSIRALPRETALRGLRACLSTSVPSPVVRRFYPVAVYWRISCVPYSHGRSQWNALRSVTLQPTTAPRRSFELCGGGVRGSRIFRFPFCRGRPHEGHLVPRRAAISSTAVPPSRPPPCVAPVCVPVGQSEQFLGASAYAGVQWPFELSRVPI